MELLAPAGNTESLTAALRCGADAVYIGGKSFSARQNASNFDTDEIKQAVRLCHRYGAGLHIAVNTILTDNQLDDFVSEIKKYSALSPDAFIVQDPGAAYIIKNIAPDIPLHASTQMTIHSEAGALFAKELGFSRVVISREASEKTISRISHADIETEIFIHGALCMSVSGQCYMSAMIGSRSANRGLCAQSCRLPFSPVGNPCEHCLSLKDLSLTEHIEKIKKAGVTSLKIEGRMKRPEYVAAAVTAYRSILDGKTPDTEMLEAVFSRSGFTDGYFTGKRKNMFGMRSKEDVESSASVIPQLKQLYRKERKASVLDLSISIKKEKETILTAKDSDGFSCTITDMIPESALNRPLTKDSVEKQLTKLGDTIYLQGKTNIIVDDGLSVPASVLNKMRRNAIDELYRLRENRQSSTVNADFAVTLTNRRFRSIGTSLRIRVPRYELLSPLCLEKTEYIILPIDNAEKNAHRLSDIRNRIIIEPPRFIFDEEDIIKRLKNLRGMGFEHLMCTNVAYAVSGKRTGFRLHGDFGLNIANSAAAEVISGYSLEDITLSFELKLSQAEKINAPLKTGIMAYGKFPLMLTVNCPIKNSTGCGKCRHSVTDRTGRSFSVHCTEGYTEIFNSDTVYLADKPEALKATDFITLWFTDENEKDILRIINDYTNGTDSAPDKITRGLYFRGIK